MRVMRVVAIMRVMAVMRDMMARRKIQRVATARHGSHDPHARMTRLSYRSRNVAVTGKWSDG